MTVAELKAALAKEGIANSAYSLHGGLPTEAYCLGRSPEGWEVYYSERGQKTRLRLFNDEHLACDFLFKQLLADATTREAG